jgi:hypothetical protein
MSSTFQTLSAMDHGYRYAEDVSDDDHAQAHETMEEDVLMDNYADENPEPKFKGKAPRKLNQPKRRAVIEPEIWSKYRSRIIELYIQEKRELQDVMDIMRDEHGFEAR